MVRPVRQPLPAHLPREVQTHLAKEEACPDCGGALHKLGEDVSEILERFPARCYVIRQVRRTLQPSVPIRAFEVETPSQPEPKSVP
jgi:transposase